jgi:hypothetical protein
VILNRTDVNRLFQGDPPDWYPRQGLGLQLVETRPEAVLGLQARQVRYWFRKINWHVAGPP